jgi:DNA-binding NarL/FixJ family response regulator
MSETTTEKAGPKYDLALLSTRERQVYDMLLKGAASAQIGEKLGVSVKTIETHRCHIHRKLGTRSSVDLIRHGLLAKAITVEDLQ